MKKLRAVYKQEAKQLLEGKYGSIIVAVLILGIIDSFIRIQMTAPNTQGYDIYASLRLVFPGSRLTFNIVGLLINGFIFFAYAKLFLDVVFQREIHVKDTLTSGFDRAGRNIALNVLITIFLTLWALLFLIPLFIKYYAYSMSFYIANRQPEVTASEAITISKRLTSGHKMDLFVLDLSYIGWYLLSIFTLGILLLWVIPNHYTTRTLYYNELYENETEATTIE